MQLLHCEDNPGFGGVAPEPIHRNLNEFSDLMRNNKIDCGLATDGDADRIGLYNDKVNLLIRIISFFNSCSCKI